MKTAVIHARVSDRKQAEKDLSVPAQLEAGRKRAKELGAEVLYEFIEGKARSAWRGNRPELEDAITFCELHEVNYFITWDTARFSRDTTTGPSNRFRLRAAGTFIEYITVRIDPDTDEGFILENIYQLTDELKSRQTSTDTKRSMIKNARSGYWNGGTIPFGFEAVADAINPKRKKLHPHAEEKLLVKKIFELKISKSLGSRGIAHYLNNSGLTNRGRKWSKTVIAELLRNEAVIGRTIFGKKDKKTGRTRPRDQWIIVDNHEPIINMELWNAVQQKLNLDTSNTDSGSPHSTYLFTGLLKCGECGAPLQIESAKGRSHRYWYYNCSAAVKNKIHPPRRTSARDIDDFLIKKIADKLFSKRALQSLIDELSMACLNWKSDRDGRRRIIINKIKGVQNKQRKLFEIMECMGSDTPNLGDLTIRLREHNSTIKNLEKELQHLVQETPPIMTINQGHVSLLRDTLLSIITTSNDNKKVRDFLSSFILEVKITDRNAVIKYNPQKVLAGTTSKVVPSASVWLPGPGSNQGPND